MKMTVWEVSILVLYCIGVFLMFYGMTMADPSLIVHYQFEGK
jgi:hypothetical protein